MPNNITDADREALKPCPFCGGEAAIEGSDSPACFVRCVDKQCCVGPDGNNHADAITAWNTRQPPPGMVVVPESVVEALNSDIAFEALKRLNSWLGGLAGIDFDEIVADGGVTAGMVVQQEAGWQQRRAREAIQQVIDARQALQGIARSE